MKHRLLWALLPLLLLAGCGQPPVEESTGKEVQSNPPYMMSETQPPAEESPAGILWETRAYTITVPGTLTCSRTSDDTLTLLRSGKEVGAVTRLDVPGAQAWFALEDPYASPLYEALVNTVAPPIPTSNTSSYSNGMMHLYPEPEDPELEDRYPEIEHHFLARGDVLYDLNYHTRDLAAAEAQCLIDSFRLTPDP